MLFISKQILLLLQPAVNQCFSIFSQLIYYFTCIFWKFVQLGRRTSFQWLSTNIQLICPNLFYFYLELDLPSYMTFFYALCAFFMRNLPKLCIMIYTGCLKKGLFRIFRKGWVIISKTFLIQSYYLFPRNFKNHSKSYCKKITGPSTESQKKRHNFFTTPCKIVRIYKYIGCFLILMWLQSNHLLEYLRLKGNFTHYSKHIGTFLENAKSLLIGQILVFKSLSSKLLIRI